MAILQRLFPFLLAAVFAASIAGCSDTWRGVKQDTGDNLENSGEAIKRAGEKVKP